MSAVEYGSGCVDEAMPSFYGVRATVLTLWLRFVSLSIIGVVFALALLLGRTRVQGWTFYLSTSEVVFEVFVRLLLAALVGIALGTICTAIIVPFLWFFNSSQEKLLAWCTGIGVVLVVFLDSRFALTTLITWLNRGVRFTNALLVAHALFFAVGLLIPVVRREIVSSLDGFLGRSMTRSIAAGVIILVIATAGMEFVLGWSARTVKASPPQHPKNNIVLITFDALSAEDMSLYGYKLPTTPNIDAFAQHATVFTNFYSTSTYTTPCIVTMLSGGYPSESRVFQLQGHPRSADSGRTLPRLLQESGYTTGGLFTNPFAHYGASNPNSGLTSCRNQYSRKVGCNVCGT